MVEDKEGMMGRGGWVWNGLEDGCMDSLYP
jgi:hypothetical protein